MFSDIVAVYEARYVLEAVDVNMMLLARVQDKLSQRFELTKTSLNWQTDRNSKGFFPTRIKWRNGSEVVHTDSSMHMPAHASAARVLGLSTVAT